MIYDYIITKPELSEDTLSHYGIKGMKWKKRSRGQVIKGRKNGYKGAKERLYADADKKAKLYKDDKSLVNKGYPSSEGRVAGMYIANQWNPETQSYDKAAQVTKIYAEDGSRKKNNQQDEIDRQRKGRDAKRKLKEKIIKK